MNFPIHVFQYKINNLLCKLKNKKLIQFYKKRISKLFEL